MEIYKLNSLGELVKKDNMFEALGLNLTKTQIISFVGAGGKTTSIHHLAEELASIGKRVIITTTTHMFLPKRYGVLEEDKDRVLKMLESHHIAVVGTPFENGKITKVTNSFYQWMKKVTDYILVEADGSKRLPIKVPSMNEPVLPLDTDMVVIVAGITCLSKTLIDSCHRPELAADILNCELTHKIEPSDVAKLVKIGYSKNIDKPYKILLNQCDNDELRKNAVEVINCLEENESALLCSAFSEAESN